MFTCITLSLFGLLTNYPSLSFSFCLIVVSAKIRFETGNGETIRLSQDLWIGTDTLREELPSIYRIASFLDAMIAEHRSNNY